MPSKWKHAGVGRNTTSGELERKNLADVHCKFLRNTEQKSILYRKKILSASVCKNITQFRLKNISHGITMIDVGNFIFFSIPE